MKALLKKYVILSLKIVFPMASMGLLIKFISFTKCAEVIAEADFSLLVLALFMTFLQIPFKIWKWMNLARIHCDAFSFSQAFATYLQGMTLATISPFAVGELSRGVFMDSSKKAELAGKVFLDKVFDLMSVTIFSIIALLCFFRLYFSVLLVILLYLFLLLNFKTIVLCSLQFIPKKIRSYSWIQRFVEGISSISNKSLFSNIVLSSIYYCMFYTQTYILLIAFNPNAPIRAICFFPTVTLSTIFPLTISGIGVREWVAVVLLKQVDIPPSVAFNCFFTQFLLTNVLLSFLGILIFGKKLLKS